MSNQQRVKILEEKFKPYNRLIVAMEDDDEPTEYIIYDAEGEKHVSKAEFEASISEGDHVIIVTRRDEEDS